MELFNEEIILGLPRDWWRCKQIVSGVRFQPSDHCMFSRKPIAYKIKKMWKYISWVSKVVEEKKKEKARKATCDQSKEYYEKSESRTRKFSTKWQVGRRWLENDKEKGIICKWRVANKHTLIAQNI